MKRRQSEKNKKLADDALVELGEPLRAFQLIRNIMNQFPVPAGEPTSGNGLNRTIAEESKCHE